MVQNNNPTIIFPILYILKEYVQLNHGPSNLQAAAHGKLS